MLQFVTACKFSLEIKKAEPKFSEELLRTFLGCVLKREVTVFVVVYFKIFCKIVE